MFIKGTIEYDNNIALTQENFIIDTSKKDSDVSEYTYDAVAFSLYGKTVFHDIINDEKGLPAAFFQITCNGKTAHIARKPQYMRVTDLGTKYLTKELFSFSNEKDDYASLSAEKYYELIKDYVDMSFEDFTAYCKS